jgi:DNA polymerase II small subunit
MEQNQNSPNTNTQKQEVQNSVSQNASSPSIASQNTTSQNTASQKVDYQEIIKKLCDKGILVTREILDRVKKGESLEQIMIAQSQSAKEGTVEVIRSSTKILREISIADFVDHFKVRLDAMTNLLRSRSELENLTSIVRLFTKESNEKVSIIGYVLDKAETKNGHISLKIEDKTGILTCLILKKSDNKALFDEAKNLVFDDVVGIQGTVMKDNSMQDSKKPPVIFVNQIILPDIPISHAIKKCPDDVNTIFIGDLHVGAILFMDDAWEKFMQWLNDPLNPEAQKVQYIFIVGDIIEGVGIYPNQQKDLRVIPVKDQYKLAREKIAQIPSRIKVIICPGNHDPVRLAEPQPEIPKEYAGSLLELPNIINVSSPSIIKFHKTDNFPGFVTLLYHGISFFYYINNVESIRKAGGIEKPEIIMEYLLKRRHLAPAHGSTQAIPDPHVDELFIDEVPDFFITGHIHKSVVSNYRGVTMMSCSCFVDVTDYQKKQGMIPDLAKVALVNLQTREVKILDFGLERQEQILREAELSEI